MGGERLVVLTMLVLNALCLLAMEHGWRTSGIGSACRRPHGRANLTLTVLLVVLNLLFDRIVAAGGLARAHEGGGFLRRGGPWLEAGLTVVALDLTTYVAHVLMHKLPFAWRFHRVHHSDADVDVTTAFRQHPFETLWRYSFLLAGALVLRPSSASVAVYLALSALNAQLEHADIVWPWRADRLMRALFASPAMHRVHHSRTPVETDSNYSNIFSLWDRVFGTYRPPRRGERIRCGLDEHDARRDQRTLGLLLLPFSR